MLSFPAPVLKASQEKRVFDDSCFESSIQGGPLLIGKWGSHGLSPLLTAKNKVGSWGYNSFFVELWALTTYN